MSTSRSRGLSAASFDVSHDGDGWVLHVSGELDIDSATLLQDALDALLDAAPSVTVDLGGVGFADVRGLRPLVRALRRDGPASDRITVRDVSPQVERLLRLVPQLRDVLRPNSEPSPPRTSALPGDSGPRSRLA